MLNQQQSITLSYLLGAQTGHDFEAITAKDLANSLQEDGEEAIDTILTAFRVKLGQVARGTISPMDMITFIDQVAQNKGGLISVDCEDADIQHEIALMTAMLQS